MGKLIALDIGGKRTGLAETDPLRIIASPVETVATDKLLIYLKKWLDQDPPDGIVVGDPRGLDGGDSDNSSRVREWVQKLEKEFPQLSVFLQDERFTSKRASQAQLQSGMKKGKRRQKGSLDPISAALILEDFLAEDHS